jgi:hypothetical protein
MENVIKQNKTNVPGFDPGFEPSPQSHKTAIFVSLKCNKNDTPQKKMGGGITPYPKVDPRYMYARVDSSRFKIKQHSLHVNFFFFLI